MTGSGYPTEGRGKRVAEVKGPSVNIDGHSTSKVVKQMHEEGARVVTVTDAPESER